jgi:putative NIF3 family GTP cyclohydrolase 1 type 2
MKTIPVILSILLMSFFSITLSGQNKAQTAGEIIKLIIEKTGCKPIPGTVDVIKEGDPETQVTGIATCMFATMDVLKKAVDIGCNLIIVHEPIYYNHEDNTKNLQADPVFKEKKQFITDHKLVIWRFHDYIHSIQPDAILSGMVRKLKWKEYVVNNHFDQFDLPETTLKGLLENLKLTFPKTTFSVIGNPEMKLIHVRLAPGAPGTSYHLKLLADKNVDVVIGGESPQWETYEYIRDAVIQGKNKAVIFIGHIPSEESGMDFCADWLKQFITSVPIAFIECGPSYWTF